MPEIARTAEKDKVRELQRTLYRAAKAAPGRRFHALYDKVHRRDVLERADGSCRSLPARRALIPKPGSQERRPLSIPTVRDCVVQAAHKIVVEPVFEAGFLPCSFGFRPRRSAHDALQVVVDEAWRGRRWVVETDIASCFEAIPHDRLMQAVEERIVDRHMLKLLRALLRAGVIEDGRWRVGCSARRRVA